jgi:uncharacterized membrane protein
MATLTVWKFDTPFGADEAELKLKRLSEQHLITLHDAALLIWAKGAKRPKTRQLHHRASKGALGGSFWGMLFGVLFLMPVAGAAVGAAAGALSGSLRDVGIDDDFIASVREQITPGTSAIFVLSSDAVIDKVHEVFRGQRAELIRTNLTAADEARLREIFTED